MHPFAIDHRSLGLFRICLAAVIAHYLITHLGVFDAFHAADKAISSDLLQSYHGRAWKWSLNWLGSSSAYQYFLLTIGFAAAICLAGGWHTRLATIACWLLVASLNNNAPYVASGGDALLCVLLFWSMFLPLGQQWSLDRRGRPPATADLPPTLVSVATAGILLQMAMMYFFTGISKWNVSWLSGTALDVTFSNDSFVRPAGRLLREFPQLTSILSRTTLYSELLLPWVMFSPWRTSLCRSVAVLMFFGFHIGIEVTLTVLIFSLISVTGLVLFIPSQWWKWAPLRSLQKVLDRVDFPSEAQKIESRQQRRKRQRMVQRNSGHLWAHTRRLRQVLAVGLILYTAAWNLLHTFAAETTIRKISFMQQPAMLLALNQHWNMFSYPPNLCMDVACVARKRDGGQVDLLRGGAEVADRSQAPSCAAPAISTRMLNGLVLLSADGNKVFRKGFLEYLCRRWNEATASIDQHLVECYLTYYPRMHHPLVGQVSSQDMFRLDLLTQGTLHAGERHGPWVSYHQNGRKKAAGSYQMGKSVGLWTFWYPGGGKEAEGVMKQGKEHGLWVVFHKNGQKKASGTYKIGQREGLWTRWHPNGRKAEAGEMKQGKYHGPWVTYYENGQEKAAGTYEMGQHEGGWTIWHPDGSKAEEGVMERGKRTGKWTYYQDDGARVVDHSQPPDPSDPPLPTDSGAQ
ncbi:MAG: HTTM domain-containing protein [Pirellulales bacterium]|nr:HTTM domain-containing protein [Pirellulales bacterium]